MTLEAFTDKLAATHSLEAARALVAAAPPHSDPTRAQYANLGHFLMTFQMPNGASHWEASEYVRLFDCFVAAGAVQPGVVDQLRADLVKGVRTRERWDGSPL